MRRVFPGILVLALLALTAAGPVRALEPQKTGIVLLHGKLGSRMGAGSIGPSGPAIGGWLIVALRNAGYLVAAPELCWSRERNFDRTYTECFADIDAAISQLKAQGARAIVVGGLSMGGNVAIGYGATHAGLAGIIGLSPADDPANKVEKDPKVAASIARAQELVAQGKGDEKASFDDISTGATGSYTLTITTTPRIFLSFFGPDSLANTHATITRLKAPLLWVAGDKDPSQEGGRARAFDKAPANPLNRYVIVPGGHLQVPDVATDAVLDWLASLPSH